MRSRSVTTPPTHIGEELQLVKRSILPTLFEGMEIKKAKSNGQVSTRVLTLSGDLFKLFLSRPSNRRYRAKRVASKVIGTVMATKVDTHYNARVIDIADILFVQSGFIGSRKLEAVAAFRGERLDPTKVVSIFHGNLQTTTDFILEDDEDRGALVNSIQIIIDAYHRASTKPKITREALLLRYAWDDVDWGRSYFLDLAAFLRLLRRINVYVKREKATTMYRDYCSELHPALQKRHTLGQLMRRGSTRLGLRGSKGHRDHSGISFDECIGLLHRIKSEQNGGKQVRDLIFDQLFGKGRESVAVEDFVQSFLIDRQGNHNATIDEAKNIIRDYGRSEDGESIDRISFGEYLFSSDNDLFDPARQSFDESVLNESLSAYWISSSHNTYLTGDQIQSKSSLEAYAVALHRGCKCLELDCHDSTTGVAVYHHYTATSAIMFSDIIVVVKNYILANPNTLPIILSLDNNCSTPFQEMMAAILKTELDEMLYYPKSTLDRLPSPKDLTGKVILKGRRISGKDEGLSETTKSSIDTNGRRVSFTDRLSITKPKTKLRNLSEDALENPSNNNNVAQELAEITMFNTARFKDFSSADMLPVTDMLSFSETKFLRVLNQNEHNVNLWKNYNKQHMMRTYPSGVRLDSSNFNPVLHWSEGCQMIALNYQTDDMAMIINDGRFRENGGCGYVLKTLNNYPSMMDLRINVLAGSCLPKPFGDPSGEVTSPYVIIRLHDVVETTQQSEEWLKLKERKTHTVQDNGFCPQWTDAKEFSFKVESPGVAMLQFTIVHSGEGFIDDTMCRTAIPVSCLRQGLRSVQFYDHNSQRGSFAFARLLVDVKIEEHVPWK